ncbi:MAG TPA: ATP-binding protein [Bacillus bacterium]|nr:ATP-binding protein [Bacillus sp. (in: firmicutes)]
MKLYDDKHCLKVRTADDIFQAMDVTDKIATHMGFLHYDRLFLRLVTEEACMNAYEYCQHTNQSGFFTCWDKSQQNILTIFTKHKGKKYNISLFANEVNHSLRGRGLQLIVNLMDHVHLEENGGYVKLVMQKYMNNFIQPEEAGFYDLYFQ